MMKLTHILASAAIISTLSACNGSLQTADRTPVDYRQPVYRQHQPSAGSHVPHHPVTQQYASCLPGTCRLHLRTAEGASIDRHQPPGTFCIQFQSLSGEKLRPVITYNYDNEHITPYSFDVELDDNRMKAEYALSPISRLSTG